MSKTAYMNVWPTKYFQWPPPPFGDPGQPTAPKMAQNNSDVFFLSYSTE